MKSKKMLENSISSAAIAATDPTSAGAFHAVGGEVVIDRSDDGQAECDQREVACLIVENSIDTLKGKDIRVTREVIRRVRAQEPIPFGRLGLCLLPLYRSIGVVQERFNHSARLKNLLKPLMPYMVRASVNEAIAPDQLEGSDASGIDVPALIVHSAIETAKADVAGALGKLLLDGLQTILLGDRTLPSLRGRVNQKVLHAQLGITNGGILHGELIRRFAPFFKLAEKQLVVRDGVAVDYESTSQALQRFLDEKHSRNEALFESDRRKGKASIKELQEETGIAYYNLLHYRHLVDSAIDSGYLKLKPAAKIDPAARAAIRELRNRRLAYIDECVANRIVLPVKPTNRFAYDFAAIAAMSGLPNYRMY